MTLKTTTQLTIVTVISFTKINSRVTPQCAHCRICCLDFYHLVPYREIVRYRIPVVVKNNVISYKLTSLAFIKYLVDPKNTQCH